MPIIVAQLHAFKLAFENDRYRLGYVRSEHLVFMLKCPRILITNIMFCFMGFKIDN